MEGNTKPQLIAVIILVSLVTALSTAFITVSILGGNSATMSAVFDRIAGTIRGNAQTEELNESGQAYMPSGDEDAIIDAVERVSPAVVSIIATKDLPVVEEYYGNSFLGDSFFDQFLPYLQAPQSQGQETQKRQIGAGSGFIVSKDGLVATNRHVVEDASADYTVVTTDGSKYPARVLARDPVNDVAILRISGGNFPVTVLGNSDDIKIGQTAIAIGNALGEFQNTVSVGVISGLGRSVIASGSGNVPEELQEVIQTDAAINPGNSGGPLLNKRGEVIAINTAMAGGAENIGFALPVNLLKQDIEKVMAGGKITYPFLGVQYVIIDKEIQQEQGLSVDYGALVVRSGNNSPAVVSGSPAERAGIKEGDVILSIGGERVTVDMPLAKLIQKRKPGDAVEVSVLRDGKEMSLEVTLAER